MNASSWFLVSDPRSLTGTSLAAETSFSRRLEKGISRKLWILN